jgi:hypothetical protein
VQKIAMPDRLERVLSEIPVPAGKQKNASMCWRFFL